MRKFDKLRHRMVPYLYSTACQSHLESVPMLRPLLYTEDFAQEFYDQEDQGEIRTLYFRVCADGYCLRIETDMDVASVSLAGSRQFEEVYLNGRLLEDAGKE